MAGYLVSPQLRYSIGVFWRNVRIGAVVNWNTQTELAVTERAIREEIYDPLQNAWWDAWDQLSRPIFRMTLV